MRDLKWIACESVSLNPYNLSVVERLRDFGYALVFDEFGNGKTDKAQLCIYSVISRVSEAGRKPNILIVCPESLLQNWYSSLISEIGLDFKFITDSGDTVSFYSPDISNMLIISDEQLRQTKNAKMDKFDVRWIINDSKLVWDLMIIDAGLPVYGADWDNYCDNCGNQTRELLVFSPCPFPYDEDLSSSSLKKMLSQLLYDPEHKESVENLEIDENIITFDKATPVTRYGVPGKTQGQGPNVTVLEYEVDGELFSVNNRLVDARSGKSSYIYGGNVFEEFNPPLKATYSLSRYFKDDIRLLREGDSKLNVFLTKLDEVLKTPENNVVVYFTSNITLNYIYKVINAVYPELFEGGEQVLIQNDSFLDGGFFKRRFSGNKPVRARIILAGDAIDEKYYGVQNVTHVFNYEYPANPVELERRFLRTGRSYQTGLFETGNLRPEEFIVFTDKSKRFDGRILEKVIVSRLPLCFKKKIPSRNVIFWIPEIEKYIAQTLGDLKNALTELTEVKASSSREGGGDEAASARFLRRFYKEYNLVDFFTLTAFDAETVERMENYINNVFGELIELLNIDGAITSYSSNFEELIGKTAMVEILHKSVEKLRSGHLYYDDYMNPCLIKNTNNLSEIAKKYRTNEFVTGIEQSVQVLELMLAKVDSSKGEYPFVRGAVVRLPDALQTPVLYNVWKYCKLKKGINKPLKEFMDAYNRGVI